MKNVVKDNSAYQNALARKQNANSALGSSYQSAQQLYYNEQISGLQQRQINSQRNYNAANTVLKLADTAISFASNIHDVVQQSQSTAAQNDISTSLQEGERLLQNSIASGKTYFGTNPATGEMELVMAPEVEEWYSTSRERIGSGNYMASIKENALKSFDLSYEALKTSANSSLVEKYYSDLNTNFATNLELAKSADIQSYVQAGGDVDAWNTTATIQGVKAINGRSDWSNESKSAQTTSYLLEVQQEGDTQIAANIARTQGLQAALDYIDSRGYYTTAEKQTMFSRASTSVAQAKSAAEELAAGAMEDAIVNSSATPEKVYSALESQFSSQSVAIRSAARDAAESKQIELVISMFNNQLSSDGKAGLTKLIGTYDELNEGSWNDYFYGIESTKDTVVTTYGKAITSAQSALAASAGSTSEATMSASSIDTANGKIFAAYEKVSASNLAAFEAGQCNGETYATAQLAAAESFNSQFIEGGYQSASTWRASTTGAAISAVQKIVDDYIPARYKDEASDALDYLETCLGLNITSTQMTPDDAKRLYDAKTALTGEFANYVREHGATMTDGEFAAWAQKKAEDYAWLQTKSYDKVLDGNYIPKSSTTMNRRVDDFNEIVAMSYGSEKDGTYSPGTYFVKWESSFGYNATTGQYEYKAAKGEDSYTFANENVEETWQYMATLAKSQITWLTGTEDGLMKVYCDTDADGRPIMSPVVEVGLTMYRFKDGTIQYYDGTTPNIVWKETGLKVTTDRASMAAQIAKSSEVVVKEITNQSSSQVNDPTSSVETTTGNAESKNSAVTFMNEHPKASIGDVKNFLSAIDNREDFEKAVSDFNEGAETEHFLDEKTGGNATTYINYYAEEIRKKKGWSEDYSSVIEEEDSGTVQTVNAYFESRKEETEVQTPTATTKSWISEHKGQSVTAKQISDYLKTVDDIEAAAKELQEAYERRELGFGAQGISFKQCLNNIVSSLSTLRRKGKI